MPCILGTGEIEIECFDLIRQLIARGRRSLGYFIERVGLIAKCNSALTVLFLPGNAERTIVVSRVSFDRICAIRTFIRVILVNAESSAFKADIIVSCFHLIERIALIRGNTGRRGGKFPLGIAAYKLIGITCAFQFRLIFKF